MISGMVTIDSKYLLELINPIKAIILFSIIYRAFFPLKFTEIKMDDIFINTFKMVAYGALAIYIYLKVNNSGVTEIDVLTLFTFILAALEATHNFMNTFGVYIGSTIRLVWDHFFGREIL
ncbi:hypothetical protein AB9L15_04010 [Lysinibacillus fusiformis]|uniref:hypothetical protein n=1 Tax=Lysinibacillus fusiformis TaxID=28031 RepID=UPI0035C04A32